MIRFYKSPQPVTLFSIPLIILILWAQAMPSMAPVVTTDSMLLWKTVAGWFNGWPNWLNFLLMVSLVSFNAIYLNLVCNKHEVLYKASYLPAFVFALFISCRPEFLVFHPIHFVNLIFIRVFDKSFSLLKSDSSISSIFDSCFLSSLAALIYFPAIVILPVMIISISILRSMNFREWIIMLIGFILPFFFVSIWMFMKKSAEEFWTNYIDHYKNIHPQFDLEIGKPLMVLAVLLGFWLLISVFRLRSNYYKNIIRTRSVQQVVFLFLLGSFGSLFLQQKIALIYFAFLAIPASILCAYYLLSEKKRIKFLEIFVWIVVATIVVNHFS